MALGLRPTQAAIGRLPPYYFQVLIIFGWLPLAKSFGASVSHRNFHRFLVAGVKPKGGGVDVDIGQSTKRWLDDKDKDKAKKRPEDDYLGEVDPNLQCGVTTLATADSDKWARCPEECPLYAKDKHDNDHCSFVCIREHQCAEYNPNTPVPDMKYGECRSPNVQWCEEYNYDGTDTCAKCKWLFRVNKEGGCDWEHIWFVYGLGIILLLAVVFIVLWVIDMECRPTSNAKGLAHGFMHRERQKVRMPEDPNAPPGARREYWPLTTNLCRTEVCGPGMTLHFNFQVVLIIWALIVAGCWYYFASQYEELFILGTRKFGLARANCILVAWGSSTQQRLMWTKVAFLVVVYFSSFFLALLHSIRQTRLFDRLDEDNVTMKDFAAVVGHLPVLSGDQPWEEKLKSAVEDACGKEIEGISIAWDCRDCYDEALGHLADDILAREKEHHQAEWTPEPPPAMNPVRRGFFKFEDSAFGVDEDEPTKPHNDKESPFRKMVSTGVEKTTDLANMVTGGGTRTMRSFAGGGTRTARLSDVGTRSSRATEMSPEDEVPAPEGDAPEEDSWKDIDWEEKVKTMRSSRHAFVVFKSEHDRNAAVEAVENSDGFEFEGTRVKIWSICCEPDTVLWGNFGAGLSTFDRLFLMIKGMGFISFGILAWCLVFYQPYCWAVLTFNYDNGQEPDWKYGLAFSMVVVVGNAILYDICDRVSNMMGFHYSDSRQATYMALYTFSCTLQVLLDIVVTYFIALRINVGMKFRTEEGVPLEDITHFTPLFETYAMQRRLAENAFDYAFPSTYLIPFILEPFITIALPLRMGILIVRSHPEIVGKTAEEWLAAIPFDMGRYADLLLNIVLAIIIFFFPGGFTFRLFMYLAACHCFIYVFDHWRVLRVIPACNFATMDVDWAAQALLAPCCGLILSCLVFKANCQNYGYCLGGWRLPVVCSTAFVVHCIVHFWLLVNFVPKFKKAQAVSTEVRSFEEVASEVPMSWFNTNPVNCLRSKYFYKHEPPCYMWMSGKEHMLLPNRKIHCYFDDQEPDPTASRASKSRRSRKSPDSTFKSSADEES